MFFFLTELICHLQYFYNFWFSDVFREVNKKTSDMKWVNSLKLFALSLEAHEASPCPLPISATGHLPDWREWIPSSVDNQEKPWCLIKAQKNQNQTMLLEVRSYSRLFPLTFCYSQGAILWNMPCLSNKHIGRWWEPKNSTQFYTNLPSKIKI